MKVESGINKKVKLCFIQLFPYFLALYLYYIRKYIPWSSTYEEVLFMVTVAAFLNGCYGYFHTKYGVELRLVVLLSLVRSLLFCLTTDLFHWRRCEASPRSQWVGMIAVLAWICDDDGDDDAWKSLRRGWLSSTFLATFSQWLCVCGHSGATHFDSREMEKECSCSLNTRQTLQGYYLSNCAVNHDL